MAFIALIAVAGVNLISTKNKGVLGAKGEGDLPLAQFAVPDAQSAASGDANIAQDDCDAARIPCPSGSTRTPACRVDVPGAIRVCASSQLPCPADDQRTPACEVRGPDVDDGDVIRVCDLFDKPLVLSFWFTRGGDCEAQEDVFERAYRRYSPKVNFLAVDVRDSRSEVRRLIAERHWTHPVGLDSDGALSNLYRVGGCPTFVYAYPGGILQHTSIGQLDDQRFFANVDALIAATGQRDATLR
jgi:thiol-disulfide isomerase/thioredoxin